MTSAPGTSRCMLSSSILESCNHTNIQYNILDILFHFCHLSHSRSYSPPLSYLCIHFFFVMCLCAIPLPTPALEKGEFEFGVCAMGTRFIYRTHTYTTRSRGKHCPLTRLGAHRVTMARVNTAHAR